MNAFQIAGAHRSGMPKLLDWCDEAAGFHWNEETFFVPTWQDAHHRMAVQGRRSKVRYPSPARISNHIARPVASRIELTLKPPSRE